MAHREDPNRGHQYLTGDDWNRGLPTEPVIYRGKPKVSSVDWDATHAQYIANGGIARPEVWAKATTVVHRSGLPNTFADAPTALPTPDNAPKRARRRTS